MKRDDNYERSESKPPSEIQSISAVTLATHDMARAVQFYRALGFTLRTGGERSLFTSLNAGSSYLNITLQPPERSWSWWGRVIFYVSDVDACYEHAIAQGLHPDAAPRNAPWGERYFHITDPDGHELSFARLLES
jgi:catechol 2,3-dioxygenase-like lactoylglutathione lyase family enzyme